MQEFLDAGFTTVLSAIDPPPMIERRQRIEHGKVKGPRLFAAASHLFAGAAAARGPPPAIRRASTHRAARVQRPAPPHSADATISSVEPRKPDTTTSRSSSSVANGPEPNTLKLIVAEGKKVGMPTIVHAVSVIDTLTAIEAHPDVLVHTPHIGRLDEDPYAIRKIVEAKIPMTSTLSVFGPHFGPENTPLFRDAKAVPVAHAVERRAKVPSTRDCSWTTAS